MIRFIYFTILPILFLGLLYLMFWPVPIEPVAWDAPQNRGYVDDYAPNKELAKIKRVSLGEYSGPEDLAVGPDGMVYTSTREGSILRHVPGSGEVSVVADTKGYPLGVEFGPDGNLYVADAYKGLLKIDESGALTVLANKTSDGSPILFADDLDITSEGIVYFTDASTKFGAEANGGGLPASLLDIFEHGPNSRILKFDPATGETTTIHEGMSFANGLALTKDEKHILVAETGSYAIHKIPLDAPENARVIVSNLPGFPDNISDNPDGTFWFGLTSPRSAPVDMLSGYPFVRKIVQRLPDFMRPQPRNYGFVARMDENGNILETLQDPSGGYALTTGAIDGPNGAIYISSIVEPALAVLER
ncbi:MAG: SMP-30/gluconolactonase/LRE family protein [Pseudomonadota bacterium]